MESTAEAEQDWVKEVVERKELATISEGLHAGLL